MPQTRNHRDKYGGETKQHSKRPNRRRENKGKQTRQTDKYQTDSKKVEQTVAASQLKSLSGEKAGRSEAEKET